MKSQTMRVKAQELGVTMSYSRPRVSNDNPIAKSLFRTCKYRSDWPSAGFKSLEEAWARVLKFTRCYNYAHKHSKLRFGQQTSTTKIWAEKGSHPRIVKQQQFEYAYLFGAVSNDW
ncbi:hypothetical protein C3B51_17920 [Pseudoalteromonas rubra]|uniref:Integrase catalytic domain-containing protein n=1 Tax=Pseudoalteromonas rubra TaxID=43658 RepID=A0A4Q7E429_9GAMM|nr:integrase core domain-containing protein [Pseudoalteromonas rubra]RZM76443.1 hypothetical protein C3B51_17920 [Pseudoalteromonas rubra]